MLTGGERVLVTLAVALVLGALSLFRFRRQWAVARAEDEAFEAMREALASSVEVVGLDTRLLRPWGESVAVERFVMHARSLGHGWLETAVAPLHVAGPIAIRATAGEIGGTKVAFLVARTRRTGTVAKALALSPSGDIEEIAESAAAWEQPLPGLEAQLGDLARRAREVPCPTTCPRRPS